MWGLVSGWESGFVPLVRLVGTLQEILRVLIALCTVVPSLVLPTHNLSVRALAVLLVTSFRTGRRAPSRQSVVPKDKSQSDQMVANSAFQKNQSAPAKRTLSLQPRPVLMCVSAPLPNSPVSMWRRAAPPAKLLMLARLRAEKRVSTRLRPCLSALRISRLKPVLIAPRAVSLASPTYRRRWMLQKSVLANSSRHAKRRPRSAAPTSVPCSPRSTAVQRALLLLAFVRSRWLPTATTSCRCVLKLRSRHLLSIPRTLSPG